MAVEYDLEIVLARLAAMQEEAISGCDAKPYWPYQQEKMPYWFNRLNSFLPETGLAGDINIDRYTIEMGLVVAHLSADYKGGNYSQMAGWLTDVIDYFEEHPLLTTEAGDYTEEYPFIWQEDGGAVITGVPRGTTTITNTGIGVTQLYLGFILDLPLLRKRY